MPMPFVPAHINATADDLAGNESLGRYLFIPGSDGRAKEIASHFDNLVVKSHPRGHHLYMGTLPYKGVSIDVASISTGMGCPSLEIILHELYSLGGKRFLRVGTAGSLQPNLVKPGDIVCAAAAVRDEATSRDYVPVEIPAIASYEMITAINQANESGVLLHTGIVHCKGSLYAREFGVGPLGEQNQEYQKILSDYGVLASEMETGTLFILGQYYNHQQQLLGEGPRFKVLVGAILEIIALHEEAKKKLQKAEVQAENSNTPPMRNIIELAFKTIACLYEKDME